MINRLVLPDRPTRARGPRVPRRARRAGLRRRTARRSTPLEEALRHHDRRVALVARHALVAHGAGALWPQPQVPVCPSAPRSKLISPAYHQTCLLFCAFERPRRRCVQSPSPLGDPDGAVCRWRQMHKASASRASRASLHTTSRASLHTTHARAGAAAHIRSPQPVDC